MDLSAIRVKVQADTQEAESRLERLKKTGDSLASTGGKLTLGLTTPILGVGAASLKTASDVSEMESKFNTVFGNLTDEAEAWATHYSDAIGRSKYEVMEAIANQTDLYIGMGYTAEEAYNLSKQATTLAYDLASFNNVNDAEAVDAITKALMGETESAKKLGINLTDTIMKTSEFTLATGKSWEQLTQAEKAQVRYLEAMKQSKNAQGDAERTAGSFANMMKRVQGQFNEIAVEIGNVMLPMAEKLITVFSGLLDKTLGLLTENPKLAQTIVAVSGALAALGPTLFLVGKLMALFAAFPAVMTGVAVALGVGALAFIGLNDKAQEVLLNLPNIISDALGRMLNTLVTFLPSMLEKGSEMMFKLIEGIMAAVPVILQTLVDLGFQMFNLLFTFGPQLAQIAWDWILSLVDGAIKKFPDLINTFLTNISNIHKSIIARMPEFISRGVEFVSKMASGFAKNYPALVSKVWELLTKVITTIINRMPEFIANGVKMVGNLAIGLWDNREKIFGAMKDILSGLFQGIKNAFGGLFNLGKEMVSSIWNGVKSMWGSFTSWVSGKMADIPLVGGFFRMTPELNTDGFQAPDAALLGSNVMARGGLLSMPQLFGGLSGSQSVRTSPDNSMLKGLTQALDELKMAQNGGTVETVINIDGREFARVATPYISKELAWATR